MEVLRRFVAIMAVVCFVGTLVSAWRIAVADGGNVWYVPLVLACASAGWTLCTLRCRKKE